jgi:hypothetical protein
MRPVVPFRRAPGKVPIVALVLTALLLAWSDAGLAQISAAPSAADRAVAGGCFGFTFGRWSPPLDLRGAGHRPIVPGAAADTAPSGRQWAAPTAIDSGVTLVLFPAWWPAGVGVHLPAGALAPGDTVRGMARAFVADGQVRSPTSEVRAWAVPCGQRASAGRP